MTLIVLRLLTSQEYSPASARAADVTTSEWASPDDDILIVDDSFISVLFLNLIKYKH